MFTKNKYYCATCDKQWPSTACEHTLDGYVTIFCFCPVCGIGVVKSSNSKDTNTLKGV